MQEFELCIELWSSTASWANNSVRLFQVHALTSMQLVYLFNIFTADCHLKYQSFGVLDPYYHNSSVFHACMGIAKILRIHWTLYIAISCNMG